MNPPLIGVTGSIRTRDGVERASVNAAYLRSIALAGGIPVILAPPIGVEGAAHALQRVDALVLTGGHDMDPDLYGSAPSPGLGAIDRPRDEFEIALVRAGRSRRLPILGICR
ncbi:MAG: gamma-glutamyl-gamma-aminobutyrate hydrolase family protein, partial [Gemmatimonadota bacterium]